ncbi:MAG TPA: choice-of-anchor tandem repeat GloVer-containing protein [Candidatus Cybelea sp.]|nr:choice-of-anchor tandem repeat GloVer-containing protein [Candidatus Cybelea sp.]
MRYACIALISALVLAACAHQPALAPLPGTASSAQSQSPDANFQELYSFKGQPDGMEPRAPVTAFNGAFYGMTGKGGKENRGSIFKIAPDGKETVLHSFTGGTDDGANPSSGFVAHDGTLYGLTENGGSSNLGTFFSLNSDGTPHLLYSFEQQGGVHPTGGLLAADGVFYGTANTGGNYNAGTVYEITTAGEYHVLYNFTGGQNDGSRPEGGVQHFNRHFYGTTSRGGTHDRGIVFRLADDGSEKVIYNFGATAMDAAGPQSGLTAVSGALYGTTLLGGAKGVGTIYEVKPDGSERVVYSLALKSGFAPYAGLLAQNNLLYGTASDGGANRAGTVFSVTVNGTLTVLHDFKKKDGSGPRATLIAHGGKFYGTTFAGGGFSKGTVFELTP